MKPFKLILIFAFLMLTTRPLLANPVVVFYFNELKVDYSDWIIEFYNHIPTSLDGWYLTSLTDTAYLKNGMMIDSTYLLVTPDSLLTPFHINPAGDEIMLYDTLDMLIDGVTFGEVPGYSMVAAPLPGQSICLYDNRDTWEHFKYLDNSPTFGQPNDTLNAMGNVEGVVTDSAGYPLDNVEVVYGYYMDPMGNYLPKVTQTNATGFFRVRDYAKPINFEFFKQNFQYLIQRIQNWPDSTVILQVMIEPVVSISHEPVMENFILLANYPNPFNSTTVISWLVSSPAQGGDGQLPRQNSAVGQAVGNRVELKIFNLLGQNLRTLVNERQEAGYHSAVWDGRDEKHHEVSSGVYIYELIAGNHRETRKMLLLR